VGIWLDVRQNEIELSAVNGYTRVVQGFQGIGFVMNIVTVDSLINKHNTFISHKKSMYKHIKHVKT
jgi:hypothetical protein